MCVCLSETGFKRQTMAETSQARDAPYGSVRRVSQPSQIRVAAQPSQPRIEVKAMGADVMYGSEARMSTTPRVDALMQSQLV